MKFRNMSGLAALGAGSVLLLAACGGGGGGNNDPISLDDADGLMQSIAAAVGTKTATLEDGNPPAPTTTTNPDSPKATAGIPGSTAEPGGTVTVPVSVQAVEAIQSLFAKIPGSTSFLMVSNPDPEGKSLAKAGSAKQQSTNLFSLGQIFTLTFQLPSNLETDGTFCFELSVQDQSDAVSGVTEACITVVDEITPPTDTQPTAEELTGVLTGFWESDCFDVEDAEGIESVKFGFGFDAETGYSTTYESWSSSDDCTGASESLQGIGGVYDIQDDATTQPYPTEFVEQLGIFQRALDFNPIDPVDSDQIDFETCYNVISLSADRNTLFLGVPLTFTVDDGTGANEDGVCGSPATRPETVIPALPLTRQVAAR